MRKATELPCRRSRPRTSRSFAPALSALRSEDNAAHRLGGVPNGGDSATFTFFGDSELAPSTALQIAKHLDEPRTAFGVEVNGGHVWHASLSPRAEEGQLTDEH